MPCRVSENDSKNRRDSINPVHSCHRTPVGVTQRRESKKQTESKKVRSRQVAQHELYQWGTSGKNKPPATSFGVINKEK